MRLGIRRYVTLNVSFCTFSDVIWISDEQCAFSGTSMLDLVERLFSRHGIRSLRFDGRMDRAARDSTLATFKRGGGPKVILIRYGSSPFIHQWVLTVTATVQSAVV